MIDKFTIDTAEIYITRFTPEEEAAGQIGAQRLAVARLLLYALGRDTAVMHRDDGSPYIDGIGREVSISHCKGYAS